MRVSLGLYIWNVRMLFIIAYDLLLLIGYYLWVLFHHGLFTSSTAHEIELPPFKYYYKEYQSSYYAAETAFHNSMLPEEVTLLHSQTRVNYMSLHFDYPNVLVDSNKCRCCIGFSVRGELPPDCAPMFERLRLDKVKVFDHPCKAVQSSLLPMVSDLSYLFAARLIAPLWEKVRQRYGEVGRKLDLEGVPFYTWEDNEKVAIAYGTFVGEHRKQYAITSYPQPELNSVGQASRIRRMKATKTD